MDGVVHRPNQDLVDYEDQESMWMASIPDENRTRFRLRDRGLSDRIKPSRAPAESCPRVLASTVLWNPDHLAPSVSDVCNDMTVL